MICVTEETVIALADPTILLNKQTELITKCHHRTSLFWTVSNKSYLNWHGSTLPVVITYGVIYVYVYVYVYIYNKRHDSMD